MSPLYSGKLTQITGDAAPGGRGSRARASCAARAPLVEDNLLEIRRKVGLLFQDPDDQIFCPTVFEDVAFGAQQLGLVREGERGDHQGGEAGGETR